MRTYATNRDFLAARALHDLGPGATRDDVQRRIAELEEREEELLVDPAFFTGLVARLPDHVWHVEILPKRMRATNELSAYRYAAVVHMKNPEDDETKEKTRRQPVHAIETDAWIDFKKSQLDSAGLLNLLKSKSKSSSSTIVPVANIPYSKTIVERLLVESLDEDDETQRLLDGAPWISSIRDLARSYAALSGADLADIADQAGFRNGAIDAVFHRRHLIGDDDHNNHKNHQQQTRVLFDFPTEHLGRLSNLLANSPLQRHQSRRLETQVRDHLQTILPPYMVPVQIVVMDRLPLNANGKIDRRELARKARAAPRTKALLAATERVEPRNEVEAALCDEFSAVLGVDVGITDNFFDLGGHSLMATRLAARLSRRLNTQISVKDVFDNARIVDLAASIRQGSSRHNAIRALPYTGPVEQSFAQGRLWFLDQLDLGASWYIMPLAVRLRGPLDVEALASAFRALELRHETLRTTFEEQDGVGVQVVHPYDPKDPLRIIHVQDGGSHLDEALRKEQSLPFDLSTEPGWRPALLRVGDGDQDHVLSIVMHHIIYDGWSLEILQRELASFYASAARGQDPLAHVPTLAIQYRDFAAWQRQEEQVAEHERQLSYWRQQLEGSQPASLFCDRPRPAALSGDAGIESVVVEGPTYENLQAYCRARQATPFIVLLAAFRAAHYRLTGMEDATVGTPIANRNRSELEDLVGFFVNTQCMRITIDEADETFESLVQQVRATVNTSFENQDVPFERIVSALQPGSRDTSRNPLVQLMFAVHSQQGLGGIQLEDVSSERLPNATTTRFDVEFHLFQEKGRLTGSIVYATDLFAPASIRGVVSVFQEVLRRTLDDPKAVLSSLPLTDGLAELHSKGLLSIPRSPYPRDASVADVFRELALSQPDAPAVVDASSTLSYSQLDQQSDTLAAWLLRRRDMADEALVGVLAPRSCDTIVAFLGILKANMAYLPLDINAPVARLNAIFSTRPGRKLLLLGNDTPVPDSLAEDVETVRLGEALKTSLAIPPTASKPSATSLAYVMYTSGSTGTPKGVMVEHRGIVRLAKNTNALARLPPSARMAHMSNIAFDAATWEIYCALLNGGTLVCVDYFTAIDVKTLQALFASRRVEAAVFPPALLKQCLALAPATLASMQFLLTAGDRCDPRDAARIKSIVPGTFINAYGPTENTVLSTFHEVTDEPYVNGVPIGRTATNSGAYIMDARQQPVPIGVVGELVVLGDGLARGYTDPALEVGRFVEISVDGQPPARAYRTGDRVRYRPDGQIEFFGRMDQQVKIRGNRVEPAEVEQAILRHTAASDAAVVLRRRDGQDPEIVSFVAVRFPNGIIAPPENAEAEAAQQQQQQQQFASKTERTIHQKLQSVLPSYMVPAQIVVLDQLPLNANGKVDRRLLSSRAQTMAGSASSSAAAAAASTRVAPRNDVEAALCEEYTSVLGVDVGVHDSFFDLGGHSLLATKLVARLSRRLDAHVSVKSVFDHPVLADLAATIRRGSKKHTAIESTEYRGPVEQSFAQARLWFIDQLDLGASYMMPIAFRLRGPLSVHALRLALHALAQRHETLRTTFEEREGAGVQVIHDNKSLEDTLRVIDVPASSSASDTDEAYVYAEILQKEQSTPFDLAKEPGWRVSLLRLGSDDDHILSIVMHHIISDGWSIEVLQRELVALYAVSLRGQDPLAHLSPLAIQYRDFTVWQKQEAQTEEHDRQLEYWTNHLQGGQPAKLLLDRPRPEVLSGSAGAVFLSVDGEVYDALQTFCQAHQTTSFAVLLAAFRVAHFRLTGADDATIGTPIANRNRAELEDVIGFFVNTQCMRIVIDDEDTFGSIVQQVRSTAAAAFENQDVPFERVVSALLPGTRDTSRNPLVQLMFSLNSQEGLGRIQLEGLAGSEAMPAAATTRFDVEFHLFQEAGRLGGTVLYSSDLFDRETISGVVDVFQQVLREALAHPETPLGALPFTNAEEQLRDAGLLDMEMTNYPRDASIPDLFRAEALAKPRAVAVTDSSSQLTYAELDRRSDDLARWLRRRRLDPETLVGVLAPRSCETVVAFLGILKANLAYLPLDVNVPSARVEMILSFVPGRKLVLVGPDVSTDTTLSDVEFVRIGAALNEVAGPNGSAKEPATSSPQPGASSLACVIFTSGSTGKPKGVMIEHRGIVRLVKETNTHPPTETNPSATATVSHVSNLAFDAATWEIYAPLLNGGTLVCIDRMTVLNSSELASVLSSQRVTTAFFTTALLKQVLEEAPSIISDLDYVFAGSEWMRPQDAQKAAHLVRRSFRHMYGPTENTTYSTVFQMPTAAAASEKDDEQREHCANGVPIGRAVSNSGAYITDTKQRLVPLGVMGELVVTGDGLARGYTDPALDRGRFIHISVAGRKVRAYRTGDRARFRPDGQIEFHGRMDQQVKVRGHRIEPAEIEQAMLSYAGVGDSIVVVARPDDAGDAELVGFFTAQYTNGVVVEKDGPSAEELFSAKIEKALRQHLQKLLPSYMVPSRLARLAQLPLTPNGKVDRRELARQGQTLILEGKSASADVAEIIAPRNKMESVLCDEFAAVLGVKAVGVTSSFFDLGGHSLMATKLAARLSRRIHARVSVKDIFNHPVLADLASTIQQGSTQYSPIVAAPYAGPVEQSFAQGRLWFLEQMELAASWYVVPLAVRLRGRLDVTALGVALQALEHRHETLRTTFEDRDGVGIQIVQPVRNKALRVIDVSSSSSSSSYNDNNDDEKNNATYIDTLRHEQTTPFNLSAEPGWRVALLRLGSQDHVLSIVMHHIVSDGWSVDILRKELGQFYTMAVNGSDPLTQVAPLPVQYRNFATWQKEQAQVDEHERQLAYWKYQLHGSQPANMLCDKPRPEVLSGAAGVVQLHIKGELFTALESFCRSHYTTPFVVLLAAFRTAHYRLTGTEDATIGTPIANRNRPELEDLIGFFVNTQCMRIPVDAETETFDGLVRKVRSTTTAAFENQDVPFERIVSALLPGSRDTSRNPLVQLLFALHSQQDLGQVQLDGLVGESVPMAPTTRFDLEFHLFPEDGGLGGSVLFAEELFTSQTVQSIVDVFHEVLRRGLEQPDAVLSGLRLTDGLAALGDLGLLEPTKTDRDYRRDASVVDLFSEQVATRSGAVAVTDSSSRLTYAELDEQSDRVASWLRRRRLAPETLIGVLAPRSCQTIVAFIGILKANLAYLPLDVNVPAARNETILSTVPGRKLVLLGSDGAAAPERPFADVELVPLADVLAANIVDRDDARVDAPPRPHAKSLAYVMFTSGSTGLPKGVMIEHRGINRLVRQSSKMYKMPQHPRVAHLSNTAFDNSTWEIYMALLNGGTVVCIDYYTTIDSKALESVFTREGVQATMMLPSLLKQCLAHAPGAVAALDIILAAGDRFDGRDAVEAQGLARINVYNAYGPTENTVTSTIYSVRGDEGFANGVPIGRAINNTGAYIVDARQQLVSMGVMGELVVTGDGLARGYTDPSLDTDRFVHIRIPGYDEPIRAYRTGDRARFRPGDGQIEFFGRIDQQIKVRGHRIEPAEIEQAMLGHPAVLDAAVEADVVGFVVAQGVSAADSDAAAKTEKTILQRLQTLLPPYMVPVQIVVLDQMPLNANGKTDRRELTRVSQTASRSSSKEASTRVPPRNDTEAALVEEFSSVLNAEVGITDSFFDLGGHSLMATKLAARLSKRFNTRVSVKNIFDQPLIVDLAAKILQQQDSAQHKPIETSEYSGPVEQSFAQGRLWFLEQLDIRGTGYLVPLAVRLRGPLRIEALEAALYVLEQRHETLRTTFEGHDGVGVQVVRPSQNRPLKLVDVPAGEDFKELLQLDQQKPFDLSSEPGWRVTLFRLGSGGRDHVLSVVMHHIISDGWSLDVLQRELATLYSAALEGRESSSLLHVLPPLPIQYRDFSVWQKQPAQMAEQDRQLAYWKDQLDGSHPASLLCDKVRPEKLSGDAGLVQFKIQGPVYDKLLQFCKTNQTTMFTALFAAFRASHYRLTGVEDATIGTPIANRNRPELEEMIGFFVNSQCLRTTVSDKATFADLVSQVRTTVTAAAEHQDVPFERIVSTLLPGSRDTSRNPLVQLMFTFHAQQDLGKLSLQGLDGEPLSMEPNTRFDMEFYLAQQDGCLGANVLFSTDLFEPDTVRGIVRLFEEVLSQGLQQPDTPIAGLPLPYGIAELREMGLLEMQTTDYPRDASVVDVFAEQVAAHPDTTAVTDASSSLTYRELDRESSRIAAYLQRYHRQMAPESLVGVLAQRSCLTTAAFLGILKANLAYLPLDVNAPAARIGAILSAVPGHKLVLVGAGVPTLPAESRDVEQVQISDALRLGAAVNPRDLHPRPAATASSLAHVIFTSGSTGKPKGVMVEHRSIIRLVKSTNFMTQSQTAQPVAHISNLAFDAATWELFTALLNGGTVVCIDHMTVLDQSALGQALRANGVTAALFTTALLNQFLNEMPSVIAGLDLLISGGEAMRPKDASRACQLVKQALYNAYGPTENTTISTAYRIDADESFVNGVPIGGAISNSGSYIMDAHQQLTPIGTMGELIVTGDGLARGYTDSTLNADRFIEVDIAGRSVRAYRTGDRARIRPRDGQIEFFGRMDQQVKIRGHRIEPVEIEQAMLSIDIVVDAAVVFRKRDGQDSDIVGFAAATTAEAGAVDPQHSAADAEREIRQRLQTLLPPYMVPAQIIVLDQLPLNANKKVDRRELAQRALAAPRSRASAARVAPRNDVEAALCEEFSDVIGGGVEVGVTDNFFDLGGHSLMATKLAARISRRLDARISVKDVFDQPVLADLAAIIVSGSALHDAITSTPYAGPVEQSFAQGRLWFLDKFNIGGAWYMMPLAVRMRGPLNIDALTTALRTVEQRHETLRTTFEEHEGVGVQIVNDTSSGPLRVIDVSDEDTDGGPIPLLQQEQHVPFNLASEPGWRVSVFRLGPEDHILSIVMHHIISDGWSVDILRRELAAFYAAALRGHDPLDEVAPLPIQYRDFAVWQKTQAAEHQRQLEYWTGQLADSSPAELLCDKPRPAVLSGEAGAIQVKIEGPLYDRLQDYCRTRQVTPFAVLLSAFRAAHYRLTGAEDATIGTPMANRNRPELEELIGFFVNTQCMRIVVEDESFDGLVQQVRATAAAAFENQDVPFERVVSALLPGSRDTSRNPLAQLMFAVHSQQDLGRIKLQGLASEPLPTTVTTRFDLEFHLFQEEGFLGGNVLYAADLFDPATVRGVVDVFEEVLQRGLAQPDMSIANLPLTNGLSALRSMGLLDVKRPNYPRDSSIVDVFLQQVIAHPERIAVKDASTSLTYGQLDEKSDRLAAWLRKKHMSTETIVGVLAPRSCQTTVAFMAVLKSSLAYLPLDVNVPAARLESILSAVPGLTLVLLGADVATPNVRLPAINFVPISEALAAFRPASSEAPARVSLPSPTNLAYVIFTSGSTGKPKGVMVEHRGIVRLVKKSNIVRELPDATTISHVSNVAFDASAWEMYTALLNGATLVCIDYFTTLDSRALEAVFAREHIRVAMLSPALLKQCIANIPDTLAALEILYVGGDRLNPSDARDAQALVKTGVYNAYGPTENSVASTIYKVQPGDAFEHGVPIGQAVSSSGAYIMDSRQQLVSIGVMGELVVTGDGLARGYTDPSLDVNRFLHVTIEGQLVRAYRTGDRARYRPSDGQIEFFGRIDQQTKIRGHRIEPAEVELAMLRHPVVRDAAVVIRGNGPDQEMVGFVTVGADESVQDETSKQVEGWGTHFEIGTYADLEANIDRSVIGNDFLGWTSMYDGTLIETAEMQEWLDEGMVAMLDGQPAGRVLEIGTGTGMILFNLGPGLESYIGLEPSASAATFVNDSIKTVPSLAGKAEVLVGTATDVGQLRQVTQSRTDMVVTNSVAQYFPSADYLLDVIRTLVRLPGVKRLFFGDMRTYAINKCFLAGRALQSLSETSSVSKDGVRQKITELEENEEELLVDPAFFTALLDKLPEHVWHVEILPKRMKATNELSRYRYSAVIHVRGEEEPTQIVHEVEPESWIDFQASSMDRNRLLSLLKSSSTSTSNNNINKTTTTTTTVAIGNVPYSKTMFERLLVGSLDEDDESQHSVDGPAWVSKVAAAADEITALSALDLAQIAEEAGFRVELSWARQRSQNGGIDAVFHRFRSDNDSRVLVRFPTEHQGRPANLLTNRPLQRLQSRKVEAQIREQLQTLLPPYMIPAQIIALDQMPVNANGKVDRRELTRKAQAAPVSKPPSERVQPTNEVEAALCDEFANVLGVEAGITDNFFDLGGQSLMAAKLAARISRRLDVHVSVKDIFDHPAPVDLANKILDTMLQGGAGGNGRPSRLVDAEPFQLLPQEDAEAFVERELSPQLDPSYGTIQDSYPALWTQKIFAQDGPTGEPRVPTLFIVDFPSNSDPGRVSETAAALIKNFDILRTVFLSASGQLYQVVLDHLHVPTEVFHVDDGDLTRATRALVDADARDPLRLGHSMLRIAILTANKTQENGGGGKAPSTAVRMVLRMNHAIYDGLSFEHLLRALHILYVGERLPTPPPFARFVQHMMSTREEGYKFWRSVLQGSSMTIMNGVQEGRHRDENRPKGTWLSEKIIKAPHHTNAEGITPATVFTAACALMLGHLMGTRDVVFGRVVSGRQCLPLSSQHIVGPCSNAVPVRVSLDDNDAAAAAAAASPGSRNLLRRVQQQYLDSLPFETLGLDDIRDNCTDWPATVDNFSCYIAYQNFDMHPHSGGDDDDQRIQLGHLDREADQRAPSAVDPALDRVTVSDVSMHDIDIVAIPDPDGVHLRLGLGINRRLCDEDEVDRILLDLCDRLQDLGSVLQEPLPAGSANGKAKAAPIGGGGDQLASNGAKKNGSNGEKHTVNRHAKIASNGPSKNGSGGEVKKTSNGETKLTSLS
ncbi:non-ribosomal peptide synthetase [Colletotrichum higginsianum]|nr:non-ribosomal peptide synthetase [Colletotrichum higginsianum]